MPMRTTRPSSRRRPRCDADVVLRTLADFCASQAPGAQVPTHTELMRRFAASERAVLKALDELQRQGAVVRRNGVGTFIADAALSPSVTATDRSTVVAIAQPDRSFFAFCMEQLCHQAEAAGLSVVCRLVERAAALTLAPPADHARPLGFIIFRYDLEPLARRLQEAGNRVVLVGAPPVEVTPAVPCIHGDHEQGAWLATSHLIGLGHRRIAFLGADDLETTLRWQGHQRALHDAVRDGRQIAAGIIRFSALAAWSADPRLIIEALRRPDAPTAIVAWNDPEALRLVAVLRQAGLRVPEDVSVIGYDALPQGLLAHPALTTVDHGVGQQLHAAITLLARQAPVPTSHTVLMMPTLVVRGTTAVPVR